MAEDLDFESFENLDDLDWSELEKDTQDAAPQRAAPVGTPMEPRPVEAGGEAVAPGGDAIEIQYLLDVELQVTVEVGRRLYFISDVLTWDPGGIIELDKLVGEPLNLLINGKPVAKGEVVVVHDKFALRLIEILDPHDRMNLLQT